MKPKQKQWGLVLAAMAITGMAFYSYLRGQTGDDLQRQKEELQKLKQNLEQEREAAQQLHSKEKSVLQNLNRIDQRIEDLNRQIHSLEKKEDEVAFIIQAKDADLKKKSGQLDHLQRQFGLRVREIYKRTQYRDLEWLLTAGSFTVFLRHLKYLNRVAEQNHKKYREIARRKKKIEDDKLALEDDLERQIKVKQEKEKLGDKYQQERQDRTGLLDQIRSKRSLLEAALQEKEAQYQAMQELIDKLEQARADQTGQAGATKFGRAQGSLYWPVKGPVVSRFGKQYHSKYKITTYNKGIKIKAEAGDPVKSVWKGRIVMVDWIRGYGKFVIVDHGEGYYTVYAHLSEILVDKGDEVMRGELIGRAGDTGSLSGTVLHFELRQGKEALDPMLWLRK